MALNLIVYILGCRQSSLKGKLDVGAPPMGDVDLSWIHYPFPRTHKIVFLVSVFKLQLKNIMQSCTDTQVGISNTEKNEPI